MLLVIFVSIQTKAQTNNTENTGKIWDIAYLALFLSFLLGLFVIGLMLYFGYKYREKSKATRIKLSHKAETRLEVIWILASLILVIFATGVTIAYTNDIITSQGDEGVYKTFFVEGRQFRWNYREIFPNGSSGDLLVQLVLEVNKKYELIVTSGDVIHSFFVYDLGIKQDAIPGRNASIFFTPTKTGEFVIRCAQYCGAGHYSMTGDPSGVLGPNGIIKVISG